MIDYGLSSNNANADEITIKLHNNYISHTFYILDIFINVNIKTSDLYSISNIVSSINVLGEPYWLSFKKQNIYGFPYELSSIIDNNIIAYTRDLRINTIIE